MYIHVRVMNGSSCFRSGSLAPSRAHDEAEPGVEHQLQRDARRDVAARCARSAHRWPARLRRGRSARRGNSATASTWSRCDMVARGKCSARIIARFLVIAWTPCIADDDVNRNVKTPIHRYVMKFGTPLLRADDHAEDQVVDRRVGQRGQDLPEPAELRLAERGRDDRRRVRRDEVPVRPQLTRVVRDVRPGAGDAEPIPGGEFRSGEPRIWPGGGCADQLGAPIPKQFQHDATSTAARTPARPPSVTFGDQPTFASNETPPYRRYSTVVPDTSLRNRIVVVLPCLCDNRHEADGRQAHAGRRGGPPWRHHRGDPRRAGARAGRGRLRAPVHRGGCPAGRRGQDRCLP